MVYMSDLMCLYFLLLSLDLLLPLVAPLSSSTTLKGLYASSLGCIKRHLLPKFPKVPKVASKIGELLAPCHSFLPNDWIKVLKIHRHTLLCHV
ncbi:hypothetical protein B0T20DRAFT_420410 [Sordaria brevicollis]|uniref:Secreted protein n=1 Tax=Sordaria brevicollis TaxID=83679 RepID=A0AAE0P9X8_SORBR|nr:hypothetical protein B0T20DRAFT_420410 [Sordaria brevicollis]